MKKYKNSFWKDLWCPVSEISRSYIRKPWTILISIVAFPIILIAGISFTIFILDLSGIKYAYIAWRDDLVIKCWYGVK